MLPVIGGQQADAHFSNIRGRTPSKLGVEKEALPFTEKEIQSTKWRVKKSLGDELEGRRI